MEIWKAIAILIGKAIKIDFNTESGKRGRFARIAVELDLSKPLIANVIIDGKRKAVEYKGILRICFVLWYVRPEECKVETGRQEEQTRAAEDQTSVICGVMMANLRQKGMRSSGIMPLDLASMF